MLWPIIWVKELVIMTNENSVSSNVPADLVREGDAANGTLMPVTGKDILSGTEDVTFGAAPSPGSESVPAHNLDAGHGVEALTVADLLIDSGANIDNLGAFLKFDTTSSPGNTVVSVGLDGGGESTAIPLVTVHGVMTLAQLLNDGQIDYT
jgi:hypothetical protein